MKREGKTEEKNAMKRTTGGKEEKKKKRKRTQKEKKKRDERGQYILWMFSRLVKVTLSSRLLSLSQFLFPSSFPFLFFSHTYRRHHHRCLRCPIAFA